MVNFNRKICFTESFFLGISRDTYYEWCRKDDEGIALFSSVTGGRPKKTTEEEDKLLVTVALENRTKTLKEWRKDPRLASNETISQLSDKSIYYRLNKSG